LVQADVKWVSLGQKGGYQLYQLLKLRIPWWCKEYKVRVNGVEWSGSYIEKGYLKLFHPWKEGDVIELEFQMTIHIQRSHPKVLHNVGKIALMRGSLVYCMEEVDNNIMIHQELEQHGTNPMIEVFSNRIKFLML